MKIYIVDYLGIHCGMDYYLEAFHNILSNIPDVEIQILSNFSQYGKKPFFVNQYKGGIMKKCLSLLQNLLSLQRFVNTNKESAFIYLSYGNRIDIPFMRIISKAPHHIIDIHEGIAQNIDTDKRTLNSFRKLYSKDIECVISHSERTDKFLNEYGFTKKRFSVPHFKYVMSKDYDLNNLTSEIKDSIDRQKINLLFFGNLNEGKGVDILIKAFNLLHVETAKKFNMIIAGKDFDSSVYRETPKTDRAVHIFARHITDDELRFLYGNTDYICLPYRKTSQSGILEMALHFKKPIIATNIPYFKMILNKFPSFGILSGTTAEEYAETIAEIEKRDKANFFSPDDISLYENRPEIQSFIKEFSDFLKTL